MNEIIHGDSYELIKEIPDESIDLICTDPPYGLKFMGKVWDKAVPPVSFWKECLRVLKSGAFAFVMCIPRQDCLARMICNLGDAGFRTGFTSIYWTYASGFPKATNVSIAVDKRACYKQLAESLGRKPTKKEFETAWKEFRKVVGENPYNYKRPNEGKTGNSTYSQGGYKAFITQPVSPEAKALEGSYAGFQLKPAVEIILVVMKPLDCKTYVEQALKNGKGVTWLDEGRIPVEWKNDPNFRKDWEKHQHKDMLYGGSSYQESKTAWDTEMFQQGRFPANVLVSDDILKDGNDRTPSIRQAPKRAKGKSYHFHNAKSKIDQWGGFPDSGSYSRYFDLDAWFAERLKQLPESVQKTFPWLIVPKPSKREKNQGCEKIIKKTKATMGSYGNQSEYSYPDGFHRAGNKGESCQHNNHPTVKSLKLFTYLITIGSRPGDVILDSFVGSGTTALVCHALNRKFLCIEKEEEFYDIACARLAHAQQQLTLL
jgi:site-specific DNA-methyltransferase (adenine-specific)